MTVLQKVSVSLLISVLLFAAFSVAAFSGLFDLVEARFYNPSITKQALQNINTDATLIDTYIKEVQDRFSDLLKEPAVQRSFLPNQSAEDIFERSRITGLLLENTSGLQWIRFIDAGGKRIHYSTLGKDILRQDATSLAYKNYGDNDQDPPFDLINIPDKSPPRIFADASQERLLFCFPFYDSFSVYRGTAVYSLSIQSITERMIREGRLKIGEEVSLIPEPLGFVTGLPRSGKAALIGMISSSWKDGLLGPVVLTSDNGSRFALLSVKTESSLLVGRLLDERLFEFPFAIKLILLASFFLTSFLIIFIFFNFKQDTTTIVRERLKRLQLSLLEEYYDRKEAIDWNRWSREMEQRRETIRSELKQGLPRKKKKKLEQDIDTLIDTSWDELITLLGGKAAPQVAGTIDEGKLQELLKRVLSSVGTLPAQTAVTDTVSATSQAKHEEEIEAVETAEAAKEVEEIQEAETVEELEAVEAAAVAEELEETEAEAVAEAVEELEVAELPPELPELEDIKQYQHNSNIRIVFGEDDIPTIIETSGLELVDSDEGAVLAILEQKNAGELEELESVAEGGESAEEELLELEEAESTGEIEKPKAKPLDTETIQDQIAREIEFSPFPETAETTEAGRPDMSFEIVSPFETMLSRLKQDFDNGIPEEPEGKLEKEKTEEQKEQTELEPVEELEEAELETLRPSPAQIILYKPFGSEAAGEPTLLEEIEDTGGEAAPEAGELIDLEETNNDDGAVIIEEGTTGLLYIASTLYQDANIKEKDLNPDLQRLVDSVLSTSKS